MEWISHSWLIFCSYFGRKPTPIQFETRFPLRVLLFSIFLAGNVIFMSYRASLTSELSVRDSLMPFTNLEGLLATDFDLVIKSSGFTANQFTSSRNGSIFRKLHNKLVSPNPDRAMIPTEKEMLKRVYLDLECFIKQLLHSLSKSNLHFKRQNNTCLV